VGLFDENFFLYYEDVDFCLRLRAIGRTTVVALDAVAYQEPGNFTPYLKYRNLMLLWKRHPPGKAAVLGLIRSMGRSAVKWLLRGDLRSMISALNGLRDGIADRGGPPSLRSRGDATGTTT
jgi:GT2 family glycosyltransferase